MQFDWTTFALEIVNFLVLVWILTHFLYRPVTAAIERRRATIEKGLVDADKRLAQAKELERRYGERLEQWAREKEQAHAALGNELDAQRTRVMEQLALDQQQEREKVRVLEARRNEETQRRLETEALALSARFAARLLERLASAEVEAQIIAAAVQDMEQLAEAQREALRAAAQSANARAAVKSAFPLTAAQRDAIGAVLARLLGAPLQSVVSEDPRLLAGLRIEIGPWVLRANLQDELAFFGEVRYGLESGAAA